MDGTKDDRKNILIAGEVILDIAPAFLGEPVRRLEERLIPGRSEEHTSELQSQR